MSKVLNYEVAGLVRRLRRFRFEAAKSVSSSLAAVSEADFVRAKSHLAAAKAYLDYCAQQPILDLPESSPFEIELGEATALDMPENESIADFMMMYDLMETEITNSQSARQSSGFISHDLKRMDAMISKMNNFLDQYVANTLPLDLPESAPFRPTTGAGRTGV